MAVEGRVDAEEGEDRRRRRGVRSRTGGGRRRSPPALPLAGREARELLMLCFLERLCSPKRDEFICSNPGGSWRLLVLRRPSAGGEMFLRTVTSNLFRSLHAVSFLLPPPPPSLAQWQPGDGHHGLWGEYDHHMRHYLNHPFQSPSTRGDPSARHLPTPPSSADLSLPPSSGACRRFANQTVRHGHPELTAMPHTFYWRNWTGSGD